MLFLLLEWLGHEITDLLYWVGFKKIRKEEIGKTRYCILHTVDDATRGKRKLSSKDGSCHVLSSRTGCEAVRH